MFRALSTIRMLSSVRAPVSTPRSVVRAEPRATKTESPMRAPAMHKTSVRNFSLHKERNKGSDLTVRLHNGACMPSKTVTCIMGALSIFSDHELSALFRKSRDSAFVLPKQVCLKAAFFNLLTLSPKDGSYKLNPSVGNVLQSAYTMDQLGNRRLTDPVDTVITMDDEVSDSLSRHKHPGRHG